MFSKLAFAILATAALINAAPTEGPASTAPFTGTEGSSGQQLSKRSTNPFEDFDGVGTCFGNVPCGRDAGKEFKSWKTGIMGNSNLKNWYVPFGFSTDENFRGNNADGIWIHDGDSNDKNSYIRFTNAFAAGITKFSLDIGSHDGSAHLTVYDKNLNVILSSAIPTGCSNCGLSNVYTHFSVSSANGVGGFDITGNYVEGNVGIDNVAIEQIPTCDGRSIGDQMCDPQDPTKYYECNWNANVQLYPLRRSLAAGTICCSYSTVARIFMMPTGTTCPAI